MLHVRDHGDSDKIVTLYSLEQGKIAAIAKGAKRSKKRFVNKLEPFTLLNTHYAPSRSSSLVRLDQAELISSFPSLREDYERYAAATLLCDLTLHWTKEYDSDEDFFRLLIWALENLEIGLPATRTIIFFQVKLLDLLGFRPHLSGCVDCEKLSPQAGPYRFSPTKNGLVCSRCNAEPARDLPISIQTVQLLRKVQEMEHDKLDRLQFPKAALKEAIALLKRYDSYLLQRELQSWNFLKV